MAMSRDRVAFKLSTRCSDGAVGKAFKKAFGQEFLSACHLAYIDGCGYAHFIVRPSQFARFLIYRNDFGGTNGFKEIEPSLFTPEAKREPLDLSSNPAEHC